MSKKCKIGCRSGCERDERHGRGQKWIQTVRYGVCKKDTRAMARLLAADLTWEDRNPAGHRRAAKAVGSLDSRGMAENKERDGALVQNKCCQVLVL